MKKNILISWLFFLNSMITHICTPITYLPSAERSPWAGMNNIKLFLLNACRIAKHNGYIMIDPKILPGPSDDPSCFFSYFFDFDFFRKGMKKHISIIPCPHNKLPDIVEDNFLKLSYAEMANDRIKLQQQKPYLDELEHDFFQYLRPSHEIMKISNGIIEKIAKPYTAIHMRIEEDWVSFSRGIDAYSRKHNIPITYDNFVNKESILKKYMKSRAGSIKNVYLATSYKGNDLPTLFKHKGYTPFMLNDFVLNTNGTPLTITQEGRIKHAKNFHIQTLIDFEVCVRADIFVGNIASSFSNLVTRTRYTTKSEAHKDYYYNMPDGLHLRTDYGTHFLPYLTPKLPIQKKGPSAYFLE